MFDMFKISAEIGSHKSAAGRQQPPYDAHEYNSLVPMSMPSPNG